MPLLQYPISGNPRRGYDVNSISMVEMTVSALWGETLTFRFLMGEGVIASGAVAVIIITVTAANIADGTSFQIAEQDFAANNTVAFNTDTLVNFNQSDALKHARNLQAAIISNAFFAGKVQVTLFPSGLDYEVTITWLSKGHQFTAGTAMPAPYSTPTIVEGVDVGLVEGYALVYQVWMEDGGDNKPITDYRDITPQITSDQEFSTCEIEVNDALRPYLNLVFPYAAKNTAAREVNARKQFWIQYGWRETSKVGGVRNTYFHEIKETDKEWAVYAALQETDRNGMRLWFSGGDAAIIPEMKFMTKRPHFQVGRTSIGWLYCILDLQERLALGSVAYKYYVDRWDGAAWVNVSNSTIGTIDGIYRVPAHPENLPTALPATTTRYRTEIRENTLGNTYASQEWEIGGCEPVMQVWFLGDLAAYEDFSFDSVFEEENVVDMEIALMAIQPFDNDSLTNYGTRLATGGRQIVNVKNYRRITGRIGAMCDLESFKQYLESFLKSPLKYLRYNSLYPPDTGDISNIEIQRSIFIDPGSIVTRADGDMVDAEISFYFHKDLNVQV